MVRCVLLIAVSIWAPLAYQYSVGGLLFGLGLVVALRSGACDLRRRADRFWLVVVLLGLAAYFAVHLAIYLLAIHWIPHGPGGTG